MYVYQSKEIYTIGVLQYIIMYLMQTYTPASLTNFILGVTPAPPWECDWSTRGAPSMLSSSLVKVCPEIRGLGFDFHHSMTSVKHILQGR